MKHVLYGHLGARSYYAVEHDATKWYAEISDVVLDNRTIDPSAVLGVIMKNYALSCRTLIQGVKRTPWMSQPNRSGEWKDINLPQHGSVRLSSEVIAKEMKERLQDEALSFLKDKGKIGILLSGGMDSRVVAAVIRN